MNITTYPISNETLAKAKKIEENYNFNTKRTLGVNNSSLIGALGEVIFSELYPEAIWDNCIDYDFMLSGVKIDVKTKSCYQIPKDNTEVSVCAYLRDKQICDEYFFLYINNNFKEAYLCGSISKEDFYNKAKLWLKGQTDYRNNFTFYADKYNLAVKHLR